MPVATRRPPPPPSDPTRRRGWLPWVVGLIVVLAAAAGLAWLLLGGSDGPKLVEVPSVAGLSAGEAEQQLSDAGFVVVRQPQASDTVQKGEVIATRPPAGEKIAEGSQVTLVVSSGRETVEVPRVVDQNLDSARAELRGQGFEVEVVKEPSDDVEQGVVMDQDPAAGAQAPTGSTVTITVSTGPEKVQVPNVRLLSLTEATTLIENAGLKVGAVTDRASSREPNTVLEQSPAAGSDAAKGSQVDLVVAAEPADVTVPSVIGVTADQARLALESAGFTVRSEGADPLGGEPAGTVISQEPAANTLAPAGSNVVIIVSTGVTPTTAQPPAPEKTPPPASPQGPE